MGRKKKFGEGCKSISVSVVPEKVLPKADEVIDGRGLNISNFVSAVLVHVALNPDDREFWRKVKASRKLIDEGKVEVAPWF